MGNNLTVAANVGASVLRAEKILPAAAAIAVVAGVLIKLVSPDET